MVGGSVASFDELIDLGDKFFYIFKSTSSDSPLGDMLNQFLRGLATMPKWEYSAHGNGMHGKPLLH
jgi:hypothetical protein